MEYTRDPFDPYSFPFDITPLGEHGDAGYLITFPDMPGCVADKLLMDTVNFMDAVRMG